MPAIPPLRELGAWCCENEGGAIGAAALGEERPTVEWLGAGPLRGIDGDECGVEIGGEACRIEPAPPPRETLRPEGGATGLD